MNNELDRDVEVSTFKNQINHNGFRWRNGDQSFLRLIAQTFSEITIKNAEEIKNHLDH